METGCCLALLCGVLHVNGPRPGPSPALRVELGCVTVLARAEHREIRRAQPCPRGPARHTPPALPTSSCQGRKQNGLSDKPQARARGRRAGKGSAERAQLDSVAHSSPFPPRGQQAPHVSGGSEKQRVCAPAFSSDQRALSPARSWPFHLLQMDVRGQGRSVKTRWRGRRHLGDSPASTEGPQTPSISTASDLLHKLRGRNRQVFRRMSSFQRGLSVCLQFSANTKPA